jgi:hypothetical protein
LTLNTNSTTNASPKYDKKAIKEFLMHLAGELKVQQLGFAGKPAPAKLLQGVQQFRAKYGTSLLPAAENIGFLASTPDGEGEEERDATRQAMVHLRGDQIKHVLALLELLGELTLCEGVQQATE